jgi:hypothetical protein
VEAMPIPFPNLQGGSGPPWPTATSSASGTPDFSSKGEGESGDPHGKGTNKVNQGSSLSGGEHSAGFDQGASSSSQARQWGGAWSSGSAFGPSKSRRLTLAPREFPEFGSSSSGGRIGFDYQRCAPQLSPMAAAWSRRVELETIAQEKRHLFCSQPDSEFEKLAQAAENMEDTLARMPNISSEVQKVVAGSTREPCVSPRAAASPVMEPQSPEEDERFRSVLRCWANSHGDSHPFLAPVWAEVAVDIKNLV